MKGTPQAKNQNKQGSLEHEVRVKKYIDWMKETHVPFLKCVNLRKYFIISLLKKFGWVGVCYFYSPAGRPYISQTAFQEDFQVEQRVITDMRQALLRQVRTRLRLTEEMVAAGISYAEIDANPDVQAMDTRIRVTDEYLEEKQADLELRRRQDRAPPGTVDFE